MIDKMDIMTVATLRPEILRSTYKSFCDNLFYDDAIKYRLIINVDAVGESCDPMDVVDVAKSFFDEVVYNISYDPSYSKATNWVWSQGQSEYCFFLEDDWLLTKQIDMNNLIYIMNDYENLATIKLFQHDFPNLFLNDIQRYVGYLFGVLCVYSDIGCFVSEELRLFSLNPFIGRKEFIDALVINMDTTKNPEKQFRTKEWKDNPEYMLKWAHAIYGKPGETSYITDIGTQWKIERDIDKDGGASFIQWKI